MKENQSGRNSAYISVDVVAKNCNRILHVKIEMNYGTFIQSDIP